MTTLEKIQHAIVAVKPRFLTLEKIVPNGHLISDIGLDSHDIVELMLSVEETFDIVIGDEHIEQLTTPQQYAIYVDAALGVTERETASVS